MPVRTSFRQRRIEMMITRTINHGARWRSRFIRLIAAFGLILVLGACTSPLDDEVVSGSNESTPTETPTVPAMTVVTPTPVDPSSLPTNASGTPESIDVPEVYVVADGDTLYSIAARFRVEIADLVEANDLSDPNDIREGQELVIPQP